MSIIFWYRFSPLSLPWSWIFIASSSRPMNMRIWIKSESAEIFIIYFCTRDDRETPTTSAAAYLCRKFRYDVDDDEPDVRMNLSRGFFMPCLICWRMKKKLRSFLFFDKAKQHIHIQRSPQDSHTPLRSCSFLFFSFFYNPQPTTCKCSPAMANA